MNAGIAVEVCCCAAPNSCPKVLCSGSGWSFARDLVWAARMSASLHSSSAVKESEQAVENCEHKRYEKSQERAALGGRAPGLYATAGGGMLGNIPALPFPSCL